VSHLAGDSAVVLGTSRADGNTRFLVNCVLDARRVPVIDLASVDMSCFDYSHANIDDGFLPLVETLLGKSLWILASPVYWYSMSAQMKIFFDRLNDLITIKKDLGRKLRGRSVAVVASGYEAKLAEGFESPFRLSCGYLGMTYLGACYASFRKDHAPEAGARERAAAFGESLFVVEERK